MRSTDKCKGRLDAIIYASMHYQSFAMSFHRATLGKSKKLDYVWKERNEFSIVFAYNVLKKVKA